MDANATTPLLPEVVEAMRPYWMERFGNASSIHLDGQQARAAVDRARATLAEFFNCHDAEVVFNSGGTEGDNTAIFGLLRPGDHFITTSIEHSAVLQAATRVAERGVETTFVAPGASGLIDPAAIESALRPETRLISVMLANNETGVLQPVEEIGKIAKAAGVFFHIDAVQGAGKVSLDVRRFGCHLCSVSAHKMHGPKGVGAMFVRRGTPIESLLVGGSHERRRRAGTENVPGIVGLAKAAELAMHSLEDGTMERLAVLRDRLEAGILELPGTGVNGALSIGCHPERVQRVEGPASSSAPEGRHENSPGQAQRSPGKDANIDLAPRRGAANAFVHQEPFNSAHRVSRASNPANLLTRDHREAVANPLNDLPGLSHSGERIGNIVSPIDHVHGESDNPIPRVANTTNIWFDHLEGEALVIALDLKGVAVSGGSACHSGATEPSHVLLAMGLDKTRARASLRFSLLKTATDADVDYALKVIPEAVAHLRAISPVAAGTAG
jgi:cysteine desulfurase